MEAAIAAKMSAGAHAGWHSLVTCSIVVPCCRFGVLGTILCTYRLTACVAA
jgi:hypothetical protein